MEFIEYDVWINKVGEWVMWMESKGKLFHLIQLVVVFIFNGYKWLIFIKIILSFDY